ncbi:helix-turn-helix transcriptional regulator [Thermosyntropha sp.]|uniref:helix-turn-helix transcriptional regulator n=1 Tax=Thermosyntropha sp. TaxID=2740820 RepID=UPI0025F57CA3|nr:helix-turn-helix transcriptional regulator [Thermosyntropha sp.]MBO8158857.1 helix-turn-helix transcriptional regulator [Thermosyntropha sp.]
MANHITIMRHKAGIKTAKEAAKLLGISPGMMYQIEGGSKRPSPEVAFKMTKIFKCSLDDIFLPFITTESDKKEEG